MFLGVLYPVVRILQLAQVRRCGLASTLSELGLQVKSKEQIKEQQAPLQILLLNLTPSLILPFAGVMPFPGLGCVVRTQAGPWRLKGGTGPEVPLAKMTPEMPQSRVPWEPGQAWT